MRLIQERIQQRIVEQIVVVPVLHVVKEMVEVNQIIHSPERMALYCQSQVPTIKTIQKTVEVPHVQSLIEW